ncbi:hypothetical protein U9R90_36505, partial [Streptomyces sp. E11-3]|uniref:hypothetical protein n=1 Tax=Streptomyces sp. E11-3 TaxID=3110112 RepID=UPI003980137A
GKAYIINKNFLFLLIVYSLQMAYKRTRGFRRFSGPARKIMRRGGQLTKGFRNKIRRNILSNKPVQRAVVVRTPPIFSSNRKWNRTIRFDVNPTATNVTYAQLGLHEHQYYAPLASSPRWNSMKIISFKAYGIAGGRMTINVTGQQDETISAQFQDYGDGTERSCISVDMPVESPTLSANATTEILTFYAETVQVIDFYVELS